MYAISRRDFMKSAGVMTLAVAASGALAGCSTSDSDVTPTQVTASSITIGDYTVSLETVKQISVKTYKEKDGAVNTERRFVILVGKIKANEDKEFGDVGTTEFSTSYYVKNAEDYGVNSITVDDDAEDFGDIIGYGKKDVKNAVSGGTISADTKYTNDTASGRLFYKVFEVEKYGERDDSTGDSAFKTPKLALVIKDTDQQEVTRFTATIPAATTVKKDDLGFSID